MSKSTAYDQTGFNPRHKATSGIKEVLNTIGFGITKTVKVSDKLEHRFLLKSLMIFNFGLKFLNWSMIRSETKYPLYVIISNC